MKNTILLILLIVLCYSCDIDIPSAVVPSTEINSALENTNPLTKTQLAVFSGIYNVSGNNSIFGDNCVVKANADGLSLFFKKNASFMILNGGINEDKIVFAGYWRFAQNSSIGFVKFEITDKNIIDSIKNNQFRTEKYSLSGSYVQDSEKQIQIDYTAPLRSDDFLIIGHRGGGRNIDRHPASENSLDMLKYAEKLGANAVEIDIRKTKEGIPVLFHDENLSKRLIKEDYFIGEISEYPFSFLRSFVTLKNGEKIPSFEEALKVIIYQTDLKFIWLDTKASGLVPIIDSLLKIYRPQMEAIGRNVEFMLGIPDEDIYNEYLNYENKANLPAICELEEDYVLKANAKIWAPRWSLGLLTDRVIAMQDKGKRVLVWTLDEPAFIVKFLGKSYFNGILTNYPGVVAYEYYIY